MNHKYTKSVISGSGILNRIKLKYHETEGYINGYLSIKTSPNNIVTFNVFANELTSSGKNNPSFKALKTVMTEYKDSLTATPDYVAITENSKYPNGYIDFKNDRLYKNLKFITRKTKKQDKDRMIFKMYGLRVVESGDIITAESINYHNQLNKVKLINSKKLDLKIGDIIDVTGVFREGLSKDGFPIDQLVLSNVKSSMSLTEDDFNNTESKEIFDDPF